MLMALLSSLEPSSVNFNFENSSETSDYDYGSELFPPQFGDISEVNSTRSHGIISFILVASMIPVAFVLFTTSMVVTFAPTRMWCKLIYTLIDNAITYVTQ